MQATNARCIQQLSLKTSNEVYEVKVLPIQLTFCFNSHDSFIIM